MRKLTLLAVGLLGTMLTAVACGSSDGKHAARISAAPLTECPSCSADGGAAGEGGDAFSPASGGGEAEPGGAPQGGASNGGASPDPSGGATPDPSGGASPNPSGSAGGAPGLVPITLAALTGTWSGSFVHTNVCERSVQHFELTSAPTFDTTKWQGLTSTT